LQQRIYKEQNAACLMLTDISSQTLLRAVCLMSLSLTENKYEGTLRYLVKKAAQLSGGGTRWRSWLRHCARSRKVACSIPDGVIGVFHLHNPTDRTMAIGLI